MVVCSNFERRLAELIFSVDKNSMPLAQDCDHLRTSFAAHGSGKVQQCVAGVVGALLLLLDDEFGRSLKLVNVVVCDVFQ